MPTPAPTSCKYELRWYAARDGGGGSCTNGDDPRGGLLYNSANECCEEEFDNTSSGNGSGGDGYRSVNVCSNTDEPTPAPTSCKYDRVW